MKKNAFLVISIILLSSVFFSQKKENTKNSSVSISIRSFPYSFVKESENSQIPKILLRGKGFTRQVPYVKRITNKDLNGIDEYHLDMYSISIPAGVYTLLITDLKNFKFPNFSVEPKKKLEIVIPQFRFSYQEICEKDKRMLKTYSYEESEKIQKKRYKRYPYKKISTEIFIAKKPFDVVIQHCGKRKVGNGIEYSDARFFYQNTFIGANRLIINKKKLTVEAIGIETEPALLQSGSLESEKKKIFFDLKTNKEIIKEP
jgi:hypothetical protein